MSALPPTPTSPGALPNLIVIGVQKWTSVLHYYLSLHPEVSMSKPKELNFFIEERNWARGVDWYRAHFDADAVVRGEASPNYTAFPQHQGVPERMASVVPDAKLIYMIRDPLERIAAHWVHNYAKRREKGTLAETLTHPNTSYVTRSKYAMQLERSRALLEDHVLVFQQSEPRYQRMETLGRIFEFLGVDPDFHHPGSSRSAIRPRARPELPGSRSGSRSSAAVPGRMFRPTSWMVLDDRLPLRRAIKRPDVRASLPPDTLAELRADGEGACATDRSRLPTGRSGTPETTGSRVRAARPGTT